MVRCAEKSGFLEIARILETEDHIYLLALLKGRVSEPAGVVEASVVSPYDIFCQKRVVHVH